MQQLILCNAVRFDNQTCKPIEIITRTNQPIVIHLHFLISFSLTIVTVGEIFVRFFDLHLIHFQWIAVEFSEIVVILTVQKNQQHQHQHKSIDSVFYVLNVICCDGGALVIVKKKILTSHEVSRNT